ncbi:hypothetical protein LPB41_20420 [Thalassospira sp. MA62]|nr:hypothetical protein [Thalassospira sp. MA62]
MNATPATMGPGQQYDTVAVDGYTSECRIDLNNADNVRAFGGFIKVTAESQNLTKDVYIVVKPLLGANLTVEPNHYAFEGAIQRGPNTIAGWYAYNLGNVADMAPPAAERTCNLTATVQPNTPEAHSHIEWNARTVAGQVAVPLVAQGDLTRGIPLDTTRDVEVFARRKVVAPSDRASDTGAITIHVIDQPNVVTLNNNLGISLLSFDFAGGSHFQVTQEDAANFSLPYGSTWTAGIPPEPQGYVAGTALDLNNITLRDATGANAITHVDLRCTVYVKDAAGTLSPTVQTILNFPIPALVGGGVPPVNHILGNLNFGNLAAAIRCYDPLLIFWDIRNAVGGGGAANVPANPWFPLQMSFNRVYVTALTRVGVAPPLDHLNNGPLVYTYNSLLHMSCSAADGRPSGDANVARDAIFTLFQPANPNPKVVRLNSPGQAVTVLKYWYKHEYNEPPAQTLNGLPGGNDGNFFTNSYGNIACGVWAELLIAMWALHGNGNGQKLSVLARTADYDGVAPYPALPANVPDPPNPPRAYLTNTVADSLFLVRNWNYNNKLTNLDMNDYTHRESLGRGAAPVDGAPDEARAAANGVDGQNNSTPPPAFFNHFIVLDTGSTNFFDPSYGTRCNTKNDWVRASIAGLMNPAGDAGFVSSAPLQPNGIDPNPFSIAFYNQVTNAWIT